MTKSGDRSAIQRILDKSRWSDKPEDRTLYRCQADAMAQDYREIHKEKYVEGGQR